MFSIFSSLLGNSKLVKIFIISLLIILSFIFVVIVLPNINQIYERLGFKTVASQEVIIKKQETEIRTVIDVNKNNNMLEEIEEQIEANRNKELTEFIEKTVSKSKKKEKFLKAKEEKYISVFPKDSDLSETPLYIKEASELSKESIKFIILSEINIDSIWLYYNSAVKDIK